MNTRQRVWLLAWFSAAVLAAALALPRFAQPLSYHDFADQRRLLGIPHMLNVASNFPILVVGAWGAGFLVRARCRAGFEDASDRWPYVAFFAAVGLAGAGSTYYHLDPTNDRLLWDRAPLAMAFMALFAILVGERVDRPAGRRLFVPLVVLGGASVVYWHAGEAAGRGDLRFYLLVQLYPLAAAPLMFLLFPARYTRSADWYRALAWYVLAKVLELLDAEVYALGRIVSGHTLKHLAAAMSGYVILTMIQRRRPLRPLSPDPEPATP